jgi:hypothetical protein
MPRPNNPNIPEESPEERNQDARTAEQRNQDAEIQARRIRQEILVETEQELRINLKKAFAGLAAHRIPVRPTLTENDQLLFCLKYGGYRYLEWGMIRSLNKRPCPTQEAEYNRLADLEPFLDELTNFVQHLINLGATIQPLSILPDTTLSDELSQVVTDPENYLQKRSQLNHLERIVGQEAYLSTSQDPDGNFLRNNDGRLIKFSLQNKNTLISANTSPHATSLQKEIFNALINVINDRSTISRGIENCISQHLGPTFVTDLQILRELRRRYP